MLARWLVWLLRRVRRCVDMARARVSRWTNPRSIAVPIGFVADAVTDILVELDGRTSRNSYTLGPSFDRTRVPAAGYGVALDPATGQVDEAAPRARRARVGTGQEDA